MTIRVFLALLVVHYLADFELQPDWMATRKSSSWLVLTAHVLTYAFVMGLFALAWAEAPWRALWFAAATFATHFATDAVTSRMTTKLYGTGPAPSAAYLQHAGFSPADVEVLPGRFKQFETFERHRFFGVIGMDQLVHQWTLALTWAWVFGGVA